MKIFLKIIGIILLVIVLFAAGGLIYLSSAFPKVDKAKDIHVEATPERLARGEYLVNNVVGCLGCHSERDWTKYAGPLIHGTEGKGGMYFDEAIADIPGIIYAKNITPSGIGDWTDGELLRVITTGVNKKGEALFPLMPYTHYRNLCEEDLYSIIVYIRSLKPIVNETPSRNLKFPMNLIVKTIPENAPEKFPDMPPKSDTIAYGGYIANAAACINCHSHLEKGKIAPGMEYAGGFTFCIPTEPCVTSANITPDNETGIGLLSKEAFMDKFRFYRSENSRNIPAAAGENNTVMPWPEFQGMTDEDLGAVYAFLRTLKPVSHKVEKFSKNLRN